MWWTTAAWAGTTCKLSPGTATLTFISAEAAAADEAKHAAAEQRPPRPTTAEVLIEIQAITVGDGDASNFVVTARQGDTEIARSAQERSPATVPSTPQGNPWWTNVLGMALPVAPPVTIHLADKITARTCDWTINVAGGVGLLR